MHFFTATHLSASHREGDGEKLSHCLHGATNSRTATRDVRKSARKTKPEQIYCCLACMQPSRIQRHSKTAVVTILKTSGCVRARPFQIVRKRKNENKRLTGASTLVLFVRSRDVAATTAAVLLLLCCCFCCSTIRDASRSTIRNADPRCILVICRVTKKSPASVFHFLHLAFWFDPGCWDQNSNSTSPPPLLLCCAAAAVLLLLCY